MSDIVTQAKALTAQTFLKNLLQFVAFELVALYLLIKVSIPVDANPIGVYVFMAIFAILVPVYLIRCRKFTNPIVVIINTLATCLYIVIIGGIPGATKPGFIEPWMITAAMTLVTIVPPILAGTKLEIDTSNVPTTPVLDIMGGDKKGTEANPK